jgi:hypothetical protein
MLRNDKSPWERLETLQRLVRLRDEGDFLGDLPPHKLQNPTLLKANLYLS